MAPLVDIFALAPNKSDFTMTSLAKRMRWAAYALRFHSVDRCLAISNPNTYEAVPERIVKLWVCSTMSDMNSSRSEALREL